MNSYDIPAQVSARRVVRVGSPASLLKVVPGLLGFIPADSLVLIATEHGRVKLSMRYDLPDPPDSDFTAEIIQHAVSVFGSAQIETVIAIGYGPGRLVTPLANALRASALPVREILRVEDRKYWSYLCGDESCCPADGTPFDTTPATDLAGSRVLAARDELAAEVAPQAGDSGESMRQATRRAETHAAQLVAPQAGDSQAARRRRFVASGLDAVAEAIGRCRQDGRPATDQEAAWITVALRDLWVRDDAWARMDPEFKDAHLRLWTDLTRRARPGYASAPAALLAFVAWQAGNGALANVALDRALADDPQYSMAQLLRQVITAGAPPSLARLPMSPEEVSESYRQDEESS